MYSILRPWLCLHVASNLLIFVGGAKLGEKCKTSCEPWTFGNQPFSVRCSKSKICVCEEKTGIVLLGKQKICLGLKGHPCRPFDPKPITAEFTPTQIFYLNAVREDKFSGRLCISGECEMVQVDATLNESQCTAGKWNNTYTIERKRPTTTTQTPDSSETSHGTFNKLIPAFTLAAALLVTGLFFCFAVCLVNHYP